MVSVEKNNLKDLDLKNDNYEDMFTSNQNEHEQMMDNLLLGDDNIESPSKIMGVKKGKSMVVKTLRCSKYNAATSKLAK